VQVLYAFHDQPDLMRTIVNDLADFWIALYDQMLNLVDADMAMIWEDMAYKNGPLISPAAFREFMLPCYQKLIGFLRENGVPHFCVDTDGDCWSLIPLFLEAGMTGMLPFEVQAGMDIVAVRQAFPRLQIYGGIDKRALAQGIEAIDRELEAKVPALLRQGGYIPFADHLVHPEVSWENFVYYRRRLAEMAGR